jgi:hypothetical protein
VGLAAAALFGGSGAASADIVQAVWAPLYCRYRITDMPDYDQIRLWGLPANGHMSCVPTSVMNLFGYAAHHGYPNVLPGTTDYRAEENHQAMTDHIGGLGALMNTTENGTGGSGLVQGTRMWNLVAAQGQFVVQHRFGAEADIDAIGHAAVLGGLCRLNYGRWTKLPGGFLTRTGGHSVTLARIERDPTSIQVWIRDPAQDEGDELAPEYRLQRQSEFRSKRLDVAYDTFGDLGTRNYIVFGTNDGVHRIIDGYSSIRPASGITWKQTGTADWEIEMVSLPGFGGIAQQFGFGRDVVEVKQVTYDAAGLEAVAIVRLQTGATELRRVNFATSSSTSMQDPNIGGELQQIVVGRHGQIYAHDGSKVYCLSRTGVLENYTTAVIQPQALGYDDLTDSVVVLSPSQRKVTKLDRLLGVRSQVSIPGMIPVGDRSTLCVGEDGTVYFGHPDDERIARLNPTGSWGLLTMQGLGRVQWISAGDGDRLYVSNGQQLRVLRRITSKTGSSWVFDTASIFDGRAVPLGFEMMRSRTNYDPELFGGPGWQDIPADQLEDLGDTVADCNADLNGDDTVDSADLSLLLANWGGTTITYDVDKDGVTNSADLSLLLSAWGGCP